MSVRVSPRPLGGFESPAVLADALVPVAGRRLAADAVLVVVGAALVALAAQVRIPLGFTPVPVTGQTFAVLLVGAALGPGRSVAAMILYAAAGLVGLPVFVGGTSGVDHVLGPTGGYLFGFVVAGALLGWLASRGSDRRVVPAAVSMLVASLVIYVFGVAGLMLAVHVDVAKAVDLGVTPFVLGDLIKAGLAALALPAAWALVGRTERGARR